MRESNYTTFNSPFIVVCFCAAAELESRVMGVVEMPLGVGCISARDQSGDQLYRWDGVGSVELFVFIVTLGARNHMMYHFFLYSDE